MESALSFTLYDAPDPSNRHARSDESLMQHAVHHGPAACVWQAAQGLVVPRTYQRSDTFEPARAQFAAQGWPVAVRHSGGGVVPQGPGILNVSLAYAVAGRPLDHSDGAYQRLCALMSGVLAQFGVASHTQAVEGSFCDGRFNLAWGEHPDVRKIAGTAQLWRRLRKPDGEPVQVVLVHGLLLVAVDIEQVTRQANALEQALGHTRRYLPERGVSLHTLTPFQVSDPEAFTSEVAEALKQAACR